MTGRYGGITALSGAGCHALRGANDQQRNEQGDELSAPCCHLSRW